MAYVGLPGGMDNVRPPGGQPWTPSYASSLSSEYSGGGGLSSEYSMGGDYGALKSEHLKDYGGLKSDYSKDYGGLKSDYSKDYERTSAASYSAMVSARTPRNREP
eukprot:3095207-Rhodomonas_salina.1